MPNNILSFVEFQKDGINGVDGLAGNFFVTVSPDGKYLYAAGYNDSAVVVFGRDTATGKLSFVEFQKDGINGVNGLANIYSVTVSPDGKYLYAAGYGDSAVAVFGRDTVTGKLSFVEFQKDGINGVDGLAGAFSVTVSPDGKYLYAGGASDSAVAVFERDTATGKLSFVEVQKDGINGVDGLAGVRASTISLDGKYLYAAGFSDSALAVFERDTVTGKLSFVEVQKDGINGVDGLSAAYSSAISPDGKYLYAVGAYDSAVAVFERDTATGKLSFVEVQKDGINGVDGIDNVTTVTVSPDGKYLYAAGVYDSAVAVFGRDTVTGKLTFLEVQKDGTNGIDGLSLVRSITVTPDGKYLYAAGSGDSAVAVFGLPNNPPVLAKALLDQKATENTLFNFTVPVDTFSDADVGDTLTYSATLANGDPLPDWLSFDEATRTFSGTPTTANLGSLNVKVTAKDIVEAAVSDDFELTVGSGATTDDSSTTYVTLLTKITSDLFTIKNQAPGEKAKLSVKIKSNTSLLVNQLCVFAVDDAEGKIDGIAPGAAGYTQIALQRSKTVFSTIANLPNGVNSDDLTSLLEFESGTNFRFYIVRNSTTNAVLSGQTSLSDVVFANAADSEDGFSLNFQDFVLKIQATEQKLPLGTSLQSKHQGELIDLRSVTQSVEANFVVNREAAYNDFVSFYRVADESGGIDTNSDGKADVLVGQAGYIEAALRERVMGINLTAKNQGTANYTGTFSADSLFAPLIIVNGNVDALLDSNPNNNPAIYFPFLGANADKADHVQILGNNCFGFEDLPASGDKDFNDMIVRVNLNVNNLIA
ncbi:beta-propeller fold lactonase family protein [Nostocaceae cyanobacterium CENA369]|uniref:Beta-propeller fold lactonase family protein n=1 Tax=Dendronalium phyllosphericum CENA369 TaxID=1725256 RepID=A0A8J7I122_9NOST|nr:beta-propeller fold lactonase family protein [Dendronalium phyllosphericum]MBH8573841.1 beta-propeller fold lactonase family protein [Dendronalium phyllosphericum CENA369]